MYGKGYFNVSSVIRESSFNVFLDTGESVLPDGIIRIKTTSSSPSSTATWKQISQDEVRHYDNAYRTPTTLEPVFWIEGEGNGFKVNQLPSSGLLSAEVQFLRVPADYDYSDSTSMATECKIPNTLEPTLLDIAESELWKSDGKLDRSVSSMQNANNTIQTLNAGVSSEIPVKVK